MTSHFHFKLPKSLNPFVWVHLTEVVKEVGLWIVDWCINCFNRLRGTLVRVGVVICDAVRTSVYSFSFQST